MQYACILSLITIHSEVVRFTSRIQVWGHFSMWYRLCESLNQWKNHLGSPPLSSTTTELHGRPSELKWWLYSVPTVDFGDFWKIYAFVHNMKLTSEVLSAIAASPVVSFLLFLLWLFYLPSLTQFIVGNEVHGRLSIWETAFANDAHYTFLIASEKRITIWISAEFAKSASYFVLMITHFLLFGLTELGAYGCGDLWPLRGVRKKPC